MPLTLLPSFFTLFPKVFNLWQLAVYPLPICFNPGANSFSHSSTQFDTLPIADGACTLSFNRYTTPDSSCTVSFNARTNPYDGCTSSFNPCSLLYDTRPIVPTLTLNGHQSYETVQQPYGMVQPLFGDVRLSNADVQRPSRHGAANNHQADGPNDKSYSISAPGSLLKQHLWVIH